MLVGSFNRGKLLARTNVIGKEVVLACAIVLMLDIMLLCPR